MYSSIKRRKHAVTCYFGGVHVCVCASLSRLWFLASVGPHALCKFSFLESTNAVTTGFLYLCGHLFYHSLHSYQGERALNFH